MLARPSTDQDWIPVSLNRQAGYSGLREGRWTGTDASWRRMLAEAQPIIFRGVAKDWPALASWTPELFAERYPTKEVRVYRDLPISGSVIEGRVQDHVHTSTISSFVSALRDPSRVDPCYLLQKTISDLPGLEQELGFAQLLAASGQANRSVNLWLGSEGTRTSFHFDPKDNLFVQVLGRKIFYLVSPRQTKNLYTDVQYSQKSRVSPDDPNVLSDFPDFAQVDVQYVVVEPGDLLFLPKLWWHHVSSCDVSISVNCWFGIGASASEQLAIVGRGGFRKIARACLDFVWLGVLRGPYEGRIYTEGPMGKWLFDQTIGWRIRPKVSVARRPRRR